MKQIDKFSEEKTGRSADLAERNTTTCSENSRKTEIIGKTDDKMEDLQLIAFSVIQTDKNITFIYEYIITYISMEILEYMARDIEKGYHASGIAKALKLNQKTVSNYLNRLQKQGMLATKTEGRNKLFYFQRFNIKPLLLNIETQKNLTFMSKHVLIESIIRKLNLKKALIFGSYAKGTHHKDSDLDIFLVGDYDEKKVRDAEKLYNIEIQIHTTSQKNFIAALKQKAVLVGEVVTDHVITGDYEFFTDHFLKHYYRDFFLSTSHPGRR